MSLYSDNSIARTPADSKFATPDLEPDFVRNVLGIHGQAGRAWLNALPETLRSCAERWNLVDALPPFSPLTYHYVAPATRRETGQPVVLKLGVPGVSIVTEIAALRCFDGRGAARLIESDAAAGALLLEQITPGTTLAALADDEQAATLHAAEVMRALRRRAANLAEPALFPTIADHARGLQRLRARFGGATGPLPPELVDRAERIFADLLASAPPKDAVLLHGDLHHGNLLRCADSRSAYRAIDPFGLIGEPAMEPAAFLLNPAPRSASVLALRLDIFADSLGLDRRRIRDHAFARAVLSACWTIEDGHNEGGEPSITIAERLTSL